MWMPSIRARIATGQFSGQVEQRGGAGLCGVEVEVAQAFGELEGADGLARLAAGEQPWPGSWGADDGVSAAGACQVADEVGEWLGKDDRFSAQAQADGVRGGLEVVEGESADCGGLLGVEQDE